MKKLILFFLLIPAFGHAQTNEIKVEHIVSWSHRQGY